MSIRRCRTGAFHLPALVTLCVLVQPVAAAAQHTWDLQAKIGTAIPVGEMNNHHDPGVAVGFGVTRWLAPCYGLHLSAGWNDHPGSTYLIGDLDVYTLSGGLEFDILHPETSRFHWFGNVGMGFGVLDGWGGGSTTDFEINGGTSVEYRISGTLGVFAGGDVYAIMADPETQVVVPVRAGFRYCFAD